MTRDDIIRIAREAGLFVGTNISGVQLVGGAPSQAGGVLVHLDITELELFASMVAAKERERIAVEFDRRVAIIPGSGWYEPHEPAEIVRATAEPGVQS